MHSMVLIVNMLYYTLQSLRDWTLIALNTHTKDKDHGNGTRIVRSQYIHAPSQHVAHHKLTHCHTSIISQFF